MINGARLLAALGYTAMRFRDGAYTLAAPAPEWWPAGDKSPATLFPFLESFLPEAEAYWQCPSPEPLRSGVWTQANHAFEATAVAFDDERLLLIQKLGEEFEERRKLLQQVRSRGLEFEIRESRNRLKSEFLASISHELRTPLNSILGFSSLLLKEKTGPLNERQRTFVETVKQSGGHLLQIINDVLDLSRIEAGQLALSRETLDLEEVAAEVLATLRPMSESKQLIFTCEVAGTIVYADRLRLKQILFNLLSNAIKFTPAGGCVTLSTIGDEIVVEDTGIGIQPEHQSAIFEKFHQVEPGAGEGSGLGLAITRELVQLHGGRIHVESTPGLGSRFVFALPPSHA